jgi:hypothetical protein
LVIVWRACFATSLEQIWSTASEGPKWGHGLLQDFSAVRLGSPSVCVGSKRVGDAVVVAAAGRLAASQVFAAAARPWCWIGAGGGWREVWAGQRSSGCAVPCRQAGCAGSVGSGCGSPASGGSGAVRPWFLVPRGGSRGPALGLRRCAQVRAPNLAFCEPELAGRRTVIRRRRRTQQAAARWVSEGAANLRRVYSGRTVG